MARTGNKIQIVTALIGLLGIVIGTFGTLIVKHFVPPEPKDFSIANVQRFNGIYIFIRCKPKVDYLSFGIIETNSLLRAIESSSNKKGWDVLKNIGKTLAEDISFENKLQTIVAGVKKRHKEAKGLIFSKDLSSCEAISFK